LPFAGMSGDFCHTGAQKLAVFQKLVKNTVTG